MSVPSANLPAFSTSNPMEILTVGYGGRSPQEFCTLLVDYSVEFLIDVRSRPYSKHELFYVRESLQHRLKSWGVRYGYMGDLLGGQPVDGTLYTDGRVDYRKVSATSAFQRGIARLQEASKAGYRVALLCSEERPELCHRSKLIAPALLQIGVPVRHISEAGHLLTQGEVMDRISRTQLNAFTGNANDPMFSRKRYRYDAEG